MKTATQVAGPSGPLPERLDDSSRLLVLLGPIHDQARRTARRLCCSWTDGDDLFQEAVLRALDRLGELRDETRFRSWFFAVLLSMHRIRWRRHFWRRFLSLELFDPREGMSGPDPADLHECSTRMAHALSRLPAVQREAVVLFEVDGFSIEEIAEMQRSSPSAVKTRLARGRARLRAHYMALAAAEEQAELRAQAGVTPAARRLNGKERS